MTVEFRNKLKAYLPSMYSREGYVDVLYDAIGKELDDFDATLVFMLDNAMMPLLAKGWGLDKWEEALQLPQIPNDPESVRIGRIKAKIVGWGEFVMDNLRQLFIDFGATGVIIIPNFAQLSVTVEYAETYPGDEAFKAADLFTPAHIELVKIPHTSRTWGDLNNSGISWGDLNDSYSWGSLNG